MTDARSPSPDRARVAELFGLLCAKSPAEQSAYLDAHCASDTALRAEVESLLAHDGMTGDLLSDGVLGTVDARAEEPPARIAGYRVVRLIGAGGMGEVYEALQDSPQRRVALKLLRAGDHARALVRRFRREGDIQAGLSHPGIAQVHETGVHVEGARVTAFIAMELVEGPPLLEFCDAERPGIRERVALVIEACDAVSHAHQRGVIHRDLKPDNILVVQTESGPRAKLLDFGVAKLTGVGAAAATMRTEAGAIIGTIAYMSPEQVSGVGDDIDTRTDIYALGLILYRLLAGKSAHPVTGLTLAEAARRICESEPARLGTVAPEARGDLETIVHKAMAREKARRYASTSELAADLRRYLGNEPVLARPASAWYQMSKFAARNRPLVAAAGFAVVALVGGAVATTLQARAAIRARDDARLQAQRADSKANIANAVAESLRQVFYFASPDQARGKDPTLREAVARVNDLFGDSYKGPPEAEAIVRNVAGIVHRNFGEFDRSREQFEKSLAIRRRVLPASSIEIADSLQNLATLSSQSGKPAEALPLLTEALEVQRRALGPDDPVVARSLFNLARTEVRLGHPEAALRLTNESLALHTRIAPENREVLGMHHEMLASIYRAAGDLKAAETSGVTAVEMVRASVGEDSPTLATALIGLARTRLAAGDARGAEGLSAEAERITAKVFASRPDHPASKAARDIRASVLEKLGAPPPGADPPMPDRPGP